MAYERMSHVQYYSGLVTNHAEKKRQNKLIDKTNNCLSHCQSKVSIMDHYEERISCVGVDHSHVKLLINRQNPRTVAEKISLFLT